MIDYKPINVKLAVMRILACWGIICLHTFGSMGNINAPESYYIQYFFSVSVLVFFAASGYILLNRIVTYKYIIAKIISITVLMASWSIAYSIVFSIQHKCNFLENAVENFFLAFIQKGKFPFFWYFGALIILYLVTPVISKLFSSFKTGLAVIAILFLCNCASNVVNLIYIWKTNTAIYSIDSFHQIYKIWTFLFYYCLGGIVGHPSFKVQLNVYKEALVVLLVLIINTVFVWYAYIFLGNHMIVNSVEYHHDSLFAIVLVFLILLVFLKSKEMTSTSKYILMISKCGLGIYCLHGWVKNAIYKVIVPSALLDLVVVAALEFIISFILWWVLSHIPIISLLVELKTIRIDKKTKLKSSNL